jgi:hypothetical protein
MGTTETGVAHPAATSFRTQEGFKMWSMMLAWAMGGVSAGDLAPPVRLLAGNEPINVEVGHAAPFMADLKGDGTQGLLVGQFRGGQLRLYPNVAKASQPRFEKFEWLHVGGKVCSIPAG